MLDEAVRILIDGQNPDGGWGAIAGKKSNTEVTALGLLAMRSVARSDVEGAWQKAKTWLIDRQNADGSWPLGKSFNGGSWTTALAMIALSDFSDVRDRLIKAGNWALEQEGSKPGLLAELILALSFRKRTVRLNNDLIGWSWTPVSASWVEPTSYFLIALKKLRRYLTTKHLSERIQQGELMIYDRMCPGGGWNYGNSVVYGDALWPYPDTTAVALIALQDLSDQKENQLGLKALQETAKITDSGLALGWSVIGLSLYGRDSAELRKRLADRFTKTKFLGEHKAIALGILAIGDGVQFFRV